MEDLGTDEVKVTHPFKPFMKHISEAECESKVSCISVAQKSCPCPEISRDNWWPHVLVPMEGFGVAVRATVTEWTFLARCWVLFWP